MFTYGVVLDACVLIPMTLCDTLLRAADAGLYRIVWSEDILEEVRRNLVEKRLTTETGAQQRLLAMRQEFPDASVTGYHRNIDRMTNDPKDHHVLAAAVTADAQVIVTRNLRHFPDAALDPYNVTAQSPDEFLMILYHDSPDTMFGILQNQARDLKNPPISMAELLDGLAEHVPSFIRTIKSHRAY